MSAGPERSSRAEGGAIVLTGSGSRAADRTDTQGVSSAHTGSTVDIAGVERAAPVRLRGVERAARVLHARAVTRHGRISGPEAVEIIERETGAAAGELVETTNRVLELFEGLDASPEPEPHTTAAPFSDVTPLYQAVAASLGSRIGRHIVIVCSHRRPIEEAPEWCLARGSFLLLADRRSQGGHPTG
jgi:hypothetical protein